jgi:hypothetical protein
MSSSVTDRWCSIASSTLLLASMYGCGGPPSASGNQTREAKVNGMTVVLTTRSDKDTELTWGVTDRVITSFAGHRAEVAKDSVTLDGNTKKLPKGVEGVTIDYENGAVTVRANGKPVFGPPAR